MRDVLVSILLIILIHVNKYNITEKDLTLSCEFYCGHLHETVEFSIFTNGTPSLNTLDR